MLSRADGVVFVADSARNQETNNGEAFQMLAENCSRVGIDFERLPLVVQFNKQDLPSAVPEAEIRERWSQAPWPLLFASALHGNGVLASFEALLRSTWKRFENQESLTSDGLDEDAFVQGAMGNVAQK